MAEKMFEYSKFGYAVPFSEEAQPAIEQFCAAVRKSQKENLRKMEVAAQTLWSGGALLRNGGDSGS